LDQKDHLKKRARSRRYSLLRAIQDNFTGKNTTQIVDKVDKNVVNKNLLSNLFSKKFEIGLAKKLQQNLEGD